MRDGMRSGLRRRCLTHSWVPTPAEVPLDPHSWGPRMPAGSSLTGPPPRSSVGSGELGLPGTARQPGLGAAKAAAALSGPGRPSGPGLKAVLWGVLGSPRASSPESQAWHLLFTHTPLPGGPGQHATSRGRAGQSPAPPGPPARPLPAPTRAQLLSAARAGLCAPASPGCGPPHRLYI